MQQLVALLILLAFVGLNVALYFLLRVRRTGVEQVWEDEEDNLRKRVAHLRDEVKRLRREREDKSARLDRLLREMEEESVAPKTPRPECDLKKLKLMRVLLEQHDISAAKVRKAAAYVKQCGSCMSLAEAALMLGYVADEQISVAERELARRKKECLDGDDLDSD